MTRVDDDQVGSRVAQGPEPGPAPWYRAWWRRAGVQIRTTIVAVLVLALVVLIAAAALLIVLRQSLIDGIDATNATTIEGLEALVTEDISSLQTNITAGTDGRFSPGDLRLAIESAAARGVVVQIYNRDGVVVASSRNFVQAPPMFMELPPVGESETRNRWMRGTPDQYRFTLHTDTVEGRPYTVAVGASLGPGQRILRAVFAGVAVGGAIFLLAAGAATYTFVGRSLRPVTRIRTTVEGITHRDLTERVPVPEERDEVGRLARTMNAMLDRLDLADRAQRQFISDASHELRSPVATLRAGAEVAIAMPDRVSHRDLALLVRAEALRLEDMVDDLLLIAKLNERSHHGEPERLDEVDLDDLVTAEARRLRATTTLTLDVHREPARALGDQGELSRMLRNLTDNAVRHAETRVGLSLRRVGSLAVLEVGNDGAPIPVEERERLFERFVRLHESRSRDLGGSGLGLAIVREIAVAHDAEVEIVDPPAGSGLATVFQVRLPLRVGQCPLEDSVDDDAMDETAPGDRPGDQPGGRLSAPAGTPRPGGSR